MNLQGIIVYYKRDTGDHERTEPYSLELSLKDAIDHLYEVAKKSGDYYKQIFIVDKNAKKVIYYKANFV